MSLVVLIVALPATLTALVVVVAAVRPRSAKSIAVALNALTPIVQALVPWQAHEKRPNQPKGKVAE